MKQNKNPQDQDPQAPRPGILPTPAHKATAVVMAGGLAAGAIAANPNGVSTATGPNRVSLVYEVPRAAVAYPSSGPNTFKGPDGKTYRWRVPPAATRPEVIKIKEDGEGNLRAATGFGNPVSFDLRLPTGDAQPDGSPQQVADPNKTIELTPAPDDNGYTNDILDPIAITETGKGGLTATDEITGEPVSGVVHLSFDGKDETFAHDLRQPGASGGNNPPDTELPPAGTRLGQ